MTYGNFVLIIPFPFPFHNSKISVTLFFRYFWKKRETGTVLFLKSFSASECEISCLLPLQAACRARNCPPARPQCRTPEKPTLPPENARCAVSARILHPSLHTGEPALRRVLCPRCRKCSKFQLLYVKEKKEKKYNKKRSTKKLHSLHPIAK